MTSPQRNPKVTPINFLEVKDIQPAEFLKTIFPAGREWPLLKESFGRHGYQPEFPIVVRPRLAGEGLEIVDGVGRLTLAREAGIERVTALVKVMEDEKARRYAIESNLYRANTQAAIKLVPAIILALEHQRSGGVYSVQRILELTGVGVATYKRAKASITFAVGSLHKTHPELESCTDAEVVAACVRGQLWPEFNQLYLGELEPFGFYKRVYGESLQAKTRRKKRIQVNTEDSQSQGTGLIGQERLNNVEGMATSANQKAIDTVNGFLTLAKENRFVKQLGENPLLLTVIDSWDNDLEKIVFYLEALTGYLKNRMTERRAALKKMRPKDSNQPHTSDALRQGSIFDLRAETVNGSPATRDNIKAA